MCYRWDDLLEEWYINDVRGLEHGYTVFQRPARRAEADAGDLHLTLAIRGGLGFRINEDGRGIRFVNSAGATVLSYTGLTVFDADGKDVKAHFVRCGELLRFVVEESGARYPLTIDPVAERAYIKASNADALDTFGISVAIDGTLAVVGAMRESSKATSVNGNENDNSAMFAGAAYVFKRNGTFWTQEAYLKASNADSGDNFGCSVSISGGTVVVGAWLESSRSTVLNANGQDNSSRWSGAAYVFVRDSAPPFAWRQQAYLKASNTEPNDYFGSQVAVSGDVVVVGAYGEDSDATGVNGNPASNRKSRAGAAYVYERNAGVWSRTAYLKASNPDSNDDFGGYVAISGDTIAVGAQGECCKLGGVNASPGTDNGALFAGAAYVYVRVAGTWVQQAYVKPAYPDGFDYFGGPLSISGDTLVVAAYGEDSGATGVNGNQRDNTVSSSGAAFVFVRNWTPNGIVWTQEAYLKASNPEKDDKFGRGVGVSGDKIIVAAHEEDGGDPGINGDESSNSAADSGAAYLYWRTGTSWAQVAYLKASNVDGNDNFGRSVAISGTTSIVGAPAEASRARGIDGDGSNNTAGYAGAVYTYREPCDALATSVGVGCVGAGPVPILYTDRPVQGQTMRWFASSFVPNATGVVLVGIPHPGIPLGSGCTAYFNLALPTVPFFFVTNATGGWLSGPIPVSLSTSLACVELTLQAAIDDPRTAPMALALSNGVLLTIGK
jgi:hypothetical protein